MVDPSDLVRAKLYPDFSEKKDKLDWKEAGKYVLMGIGILLIAYDFYKMRREKCLRENSII